MDNTEIALKSAGPPGSSYVNSQPRIGRAFVSITFSEFMLAQPEPADLTEEVRAAEAAIEETGKRIPYEQFRRQLGLEQVPEPYAVELTPAAQRDLAALARKPPDKDLLKGLDEAIRGLGKDPRPPGAIKLHGSDFWRIVEDDYRIIYAIDDKGRLVTVTRVRHRRDAHK